MAKGKAAAGRKTKKKTAKTAKGVASAVPGKSEKKGGKKSRSNAVDTLWKLADHPLVGELIAIGATAAVAAIAQQGLAKKSKKQGSARAVKEAGKAAAAAIGARLISEFAEDKDEPKAKSAKA